MACDPSAAGWLLSSAGDDGTVTGIDMNVGQVATGDGESLHAPVTGRLEARCKRRRRRMSRKDSRRRERIR